jgi:hypothetical protein
MSLAAGCGTPEEPEPPPFCEGPELVIDEGTQGAHGIAADSSGVYWAMYHGSIRKAPLEGGEVTGLNILGKYAPPERMALDDDNLYWVDRSEGTVAFVPKKGGDITVLIKDQYVPNSIAVDETDVYWTASASSSVQGIAYRTPKTGGGITPIATAVDQPTDMVLDRGTLYVAYLGFASGQSQGKGGIVAVDLESFDTRTVVELDQGAPCAMASDADHLYFSYTTQDPTVSADSIGVVSKSGGDITRLATGTGAICKVVVDREYVYYVGSEIYGSPLKGFLRRVPKEGGSVTTLSELEGRSYAGLARYADALYFTRAWSNQELPSVHRVCAQ